VCGITVVGDAGPVICGPPGAGEAVGDGGGGSSGTALTGVSAELSADKPTPAMIAAAPARHLILTVIRYLPTLLNTATVRPTQYNAELLVQRRAAMSAVITQFGANSPVARQKKLARRGFRLGTLRRIQGLPAAASGATTPGATVFPTLFGRNAGRWWIARILFEDWR
jgi:hypothetical protein